MDSFTSSVHKELSRWKWFLFNQKYRFDLGYQFLVLVNFVLLVITASDKLRHYTQIPRTWILLLIAVPLGFIGVWLFGWFLDRVVRYGQAYQLEASKRNPIWDIQRSQLDRIEKGLSEIQAKLG